MSAFEPHWQHCLPGMTREWCALCSTFTTGPVWKHMGTPTCADRVVCEACADVVGCSA